MYPMPDGAICVTTFEGRVLSQQMLSTFHYRFDLPGGTTDGALILESLNNALFAPGALFDVFLANMSSGYTGLRIRSQWLIPERRAYVDKTLFGAVGGVASEVMGPNVSAIILKRSEAAGGHGRGMLHIPGVPKSYVTAGSLNAIAIAGYEDVGNQIATPVALLAGTFTPVIYNRTLPGDSNEIIGTSVYSDVRTMHRRTVGLGS